jgi:hypothetical protein
VLTAGPFVLQKVVSGIDEPDLDAMLQLADGHKSPVRPGDSWLGYGLAAAGAHLPAVGVHQIGDMDGPQRVLGVLHQDKLARHGNRSPRLRTGLDEREEPG